MGSADWTALANGADGTVIDQGVTAGATPPPGGGNFVYGYNALTSSAGACGIYCNGSGFAPSANFKGGQITGAVQRGGPIGAVGFSPFLFILAQGTTVNDVAYMLGLQDGTPYRIGLVKGQMAKGIPIGAITSPPTNGVLRVGTNTYNAGVIWHQLRMDAVVNLNGDVILKAFQSDLTANGASVGSPTWVPVPGLEDPNLVPTFGAGTCFVDDVLRINSGSAPYTAGRMGLGFQSANVSVRSFFDQITCAVQT